MSVNISLTSCLRVDVMHSYMGLAGLALMGEPGIRPLNPLLSASTRIMERLHKETVFWKTAQ